MLCGASILSNGANHHVCELRIADYCITREKQYHQQALVTVAIGGYRVHYEGECYQDNGELVSCTSSQHYQSSQELHKLDILSLGVMNDAILRNVLSVLY